FESEILFYAAGFNGLFNVCIDSPCVTHANGLSLDGSQLYRGSEFSPTLGPGTYSSAQFFISVNITTFLEPNATVVVSALPEPGVMSGCFWPSCFRAAAAEENCGPAAVNQLWP